MITEQAIVTRRDGNRVEIELERGSACGNCEMNQGCGTGAIGRLLGRRSRPLVIETEQPLRPGDRVQLGLPEAALVKASLLTYGLPLLAMVAAGLVAAASGLGDGWVALTAVVGFAAGFKLAARLSRSLEACRLTPYIMEIELNPDR